MTTAKHFTYYASADTSTKFCPCGASIDFPCDIRGYAEEWHKQHAPHVETKATEHFITDDGMRLMTSDTPRHHWEGEGK